MQHPATPAHIHPLPLGDRPSPDFDSAAPRDRHLLGFLLLSLLLHGAWLLMPLRQPASKGKPPHVSPLAVHLAPAPRQVAAMPVVPVPGAMRRPSAISQRMTAQSPDTALPRAEPPTTPLAEPRHPAVNMQQALATARRIATERQPTPNPFAAPALPLTVEAAVARATAPDITIETRGAAGQYVTKSKHNRCVTPLTVPHFLEGKSMLTQCDAWKG